jgi:RNA-binding protein
MKKSIMSDLVDPLNPMDKLRVRTLKAAAHALKPVVTIGEKGLTKAVDHEVNIALDAHELLKIRIQGSSKIERREMADQLCQTHAAHLIQMIGHTLTIYRQSTKK